MSKPPPRFIPANDPRHGTNAGYAAGCRMFCCRKAHSDYTNQRKAERIARGIPEHVHGTANGYRNYSCRCDRCLIGMVGWPPGHALGMVEELTSKGHSAAQIAERLGLSKRTVQRYRIALGISTPPAAPLTPEEDERIRAMLEDGASCAEIARTIGRHPDTIHRNYKGMSKASNMAGLRALSNQVGLPLY